MLDVDGIIGSGATLAFADLKPYLDAGVPRQKQAFIDHAWSVSGQTRVGGPRGAGRITASRALQMLGEK